MNTHMHATHAYIMHVSQEEDRFFWRTKGKINICQANASHPVLLLRSWIDAGQIVATHFLEL